MTEWKKGPNPSFHRNIDHHLNYDQEVRVFKSSFTPPYVTNGIDNWSKEILQSINYGVTGV